jgi:hypothetical protein
MRGLVASDSAAVCVALFVICIPASFHNFLPFESDNRNKQHRKNEETEGRGFFYMT